MELCNSRVSWYTNQSVLYQQLLLTNMAYINVIHAGFTYNYFFKTKGS